MHKTIVTKNADETRNFGREFAQHLKKGGVLALFGDLGAGKTTFVQGLAEGLGIKNRIISPTFIIMREYKLPYSSSEQSESRSKSSRQARTIRFYHIDLYRTESQKDIEGLGIQEILSDPENIVVIEWAEKMGNLLPKNAIKISFEYGNDDERKITWKT